MKGYERTLFLGDFADSGRFPKMIDVEVAVCFTDLRGFTKYVHSLQKDGQDNRVQHFLRDYFQIYPQEVLHELWHMEERDEDRDTSVDAELRRLLVPSAYKNLGDGMMLIWELQDASNMRIQGLATRAIFSIVEKFKERFHEMTHDLGPVEIDSYSRHAEALKLGIGLARGHAWRMDFGHSRPIDYAGSIVNLAARLQGYARPEGVVAQLGFSESWFRHLAKKGKGRIQNISSIKGMESNPIDIWTSNEVALSKTP